MSVPSAGIIRGRPYVHLQPGAAHSRRYAETRQCTATANEHLDHDRRNINGPGTQHSAAYVSQTREQCRFTISRVAADWHPLIAPQRTMWHRDYGRPLVLIFAVQLTPHTPVICTRQQRNKAYLQSIYHCNFS